MVLEADPKLSPLLTAGKKKIGVRLSSHPVPTRLATHDELMALGRTIGAFNHGIIEVLPPSVAVMDETDQQGVQRHPVIPQHQPFHLVGQEQGLGAEGILDDLPVLAHGKHRRGDADGDDQQGQQPENPPAECSVNDGNGNFNREVVVGSSNLNLPAVVFNGCNAQIVANVAF